MRSEAQRRRIRTATSDAMRRSADQRACRKCGRRGAMARIETEFVIASRCRWCGYTRGILRGSLAPFEEGEQ